MRRKLSKLMACLLTFCMLMSLMPATAFAIPATHAHAICGAAHTDIGDHTGSCEDITWTAWDGTDKDGETDGIQLTAGSWYLTDNVNLTETLTISSGTVNLCLNGKTITNRKNITVSSGATLNICACGSGGTVKAIVNSDGNITNNGTVNVYGGTVQGSGSGNTVKGSGIDNYGTVNVYGGTVKAPHGQGHGIYNEAKGTANIYDGTVSSGSSEGILNKKYFTSGIVNVYGGTVIGATNGITNNGILNLSGGSVGNLDGNYGISNNGTLNLSGAPTITGTWADIYLNSDKLITIGEGGLTYTSDKAISVRMNTPGTFTSGWTTKMGENAANYDRYFTSANDGYIVQPDGNNELELAEPPTSYTVTYNGNGATSGDVPADSNSPYISGSTVTVLGNTGNLAKTGYAFVGWNTWSSGYGTDYAPGDTFNINSNTTLYAQWEEYEITTQPTESTPAVGTNADGDIASYQWYKGTMSEVTDTADGVSAYTEDTLTSSYSDGWWTCHEAGGYSTPGYFNIALNAGDSILAQTSATISEGQLGIWAAYEKQDWDWTTPDDHFLVTAPADGNYDLHVSDVTYGGGTQPTVKAQVFHIGSTPADGATSKTFEADEDGWYACKITYKDGTVLYSGPVEYEAPSIPVTGVELSESSLTLGVGSTETLTATVSPNNATNKAVTWSSNNESVATVADGVVSAIGEGTATITVTTADGGKTDTCIVTVLAAHEHPICGVANCTNTTHNHSEVSEWVKLTKENISSYVTKSGSSYILTPGSYYLGEDITLSYVANDCTFIYVNASGTYNVCLNGNTITGSGSAPVFRANGTNAVLNICDCSEPSTGKITGGKNGGVYIDDGTVNLYGGSITGNTVYQQGAGVYVSSGTFNMYGGSITNNTFTSGSDRKGGGVYVSSGTFNMYGGTISDHVSSDGGGVYVYSGTFNMSGGTISGNTASTYGGGVYVYSGTFTMTGGEITGNSANYYSGGVYNQAGKFNVSGSPVVTDNTVGTAENNIYCANDITIIGALTADAQIGVNYYTETTFTSGWNTYMDGEGENIYKYFTPDDSAKYDIRETDGELQLVEKPAHVCQWSYSIKADQTDIIVATCNGEGECTSTANKELAIIKPLHIEVNDGKNAAATLSATSIGGITELPDIVYYKYSQYPNIDESSATTTPFENVGGTYKAQITVGGVTAYTNYTIERLGRASINQFTISDVTVNSFVITLDEADRSKTDFVCEFSDKYKIEFTPDTNGRATITVPDVYAGSNNLWVFVYQKQTDIYKKSNTKDTTVSLKNPEYTVIFNANGGSGTMANQTIEVGTETALSPTSFTRSGYKFSGWATSADGAKVYDDKQSVTDIAAAGESITLFAVWTEKATITISDVQQQYDYSGEPIEFNLNSPLTGFTVKYRVKDTTTWSDSIPTEVNIYDVEITRAEDADYKKYEMTFFGKLVINKAIVNVPTVASKVYTGENQTANISETADYTVTTNNGGITVGQYDVVLNLKDSANYKWSDGTETAAKTIKFEIKKATENAIIDLAIEGWTFGESAKTPSASATFGTPAFTYVGIGETVYTESATPPANAGTYKVIAKVADTANYTGASYEMKFAIAKATPSISAPTAKTGLVYNGADKALVSAGTTSGGEMQYSLDGSTWATEIPQGNSAGSYTVYYKVVGDANHDDNAGSYVSVTIGKADKTAPEVAGVDETIKSKADGRITGVDDTMEYKKQGDVNYIAITADTVENLAAGTYLVRYKETENYFASYDKQIVIADGVMLTIAFNSNEGTSVDSVTCEWNQTITAPTEPTKDGFEFISWYLDDTLTTKWTNEYQFTADTTLYAKWVQGTVSDYEDHVDEIEADGLNDVAKAEETDIKLVVQVEEATEGDSEQTAIKGIADAPNNFGFYDITLEKSSGGYVTNASSVIEIKLPYDFTRKTNIKVYRYHSGVSEELAQLDARATAPYVDGKCYVDKSNNCIYIYSSKFSTYAVAYDTVRSSLGGGTTRYTVKFDTNGGSSVSSATVTKNAKVAEPKTPEKDGYTFGGWYTDKEFAEKYDFESKVTKNFTLYAKWDKHDDEQSSTDTHNCPSLAFDDLDITKWYHFDTDYVIENGIFKGTTETTFEPDSAQTRAMMVTVLYRVEGEPAVNRSIPFADVDMGAYYANAVIWGQQNGIIKGYSETEFGPDDKITREQIAAIMHRYAQYKGYDVSIGENTNILSYDDFDSISEYAIPSMQWAVGSGLIKGKSESTLNPLDNATRAEIAAILHRFIEANK